MHASATVESRTTIRASALVAPIVVYAVALVVRLAVIPAVSFTLNEGSAYYMAVARNIAAGRGPVIDAIWSYATPPLTLPRPAFELWQPLASYLAAVPMQLFGPGLASAQLGFALVGALLAPLAWLIARDAAARLNVPDERATWVALGAGLLVGVSGPFVLSTAVPDSTLPFTVLAVGACVAMPRAVRGGRAQVVALGVLLGLAYLTRMEAVYLGLVFVAFVWSAGARRMELVRRVGAVALVAALVALPWWLRNLEVFGTPLPAQLADNAFLTANAQIFDYVARANVATFLAQGPAVILGNVAAALWHDTVDVLILPGNVVTIAGLVTIAFGWRRRRALSGSPLVALLGYGALCFAVTTLAFPVATLWGTFEHAAGPLLVAFAVLAVLGGDAVVVRIRAWRRWPRPNAGMAPAALAAVAFAIAALQLTLVSVQAQARQDQTASTAALVRAAVGPEGTTPIITDHPVWLSDALGAPTLALPDEDAAAVLALAHRFGAHTVVTTDAPGPAVPALLAAGDCFTRVPLGASDSAPNVVVLRISEACR